MDRLQRVENRHTLSLEAVNLNVYRGWQEAIIVPRLIEKIRRAQSIRDPSLPDSIEELEGWYQQTERTVYTIGRQATTMLGIAHFSSETHGNASYQFGSRMYDSRIDRDAAASFVAAIHHDFTSHKRYEGRVWTKLDERDREKRLVYEKNGYREVSHHRGAALLVRSAISKMDF